MRTRSLPTRIFKALKVTVTQQLLTSNTETYVSTARDGFQYSSTMRTYVTVFQSSAASLKDAAACRACNHTTQPSASQSCMLVIQVPCSVGTTLHVRMVLVQKGKWHNLRRYPAMTIEVFRDMTQLGKLFPSFRKAVMPSYSGLCSQKKKYSSSSSWTA